MNILLIHQVFLLPGESGSTRHFELSKFLVKKGHKVTAIGSSVNYLSGKSNPGKNSGDFICEGVRVIRPWTYASIHKNYFSRLLSFLSFMTTSTFAGLKVKNIDMVIGCSPQIFAGVTAYIISKIRKVPFVFEVRDLWPLFAIETGVLNNSIFIRLAEALEKFLYNKAEYFIINSPGFYNHLESFGVSRDKIFFVPNGVDTGMFNSEHKTIQELEAVKNKFVVLYAGAHGRANGLDTLIETAAILRDHKDILFLFVGDGNEKQKLIQLSKQLKLKNILFVKPISKDMMPSAINYADICIAHLRRNKAFKTVYPNKVFDYMAAGKALIISIDGVIREVVEKANAGLYARWDDPDNIAGVVLNMYKDKENLNLYGENGMKYVKTHFEREKIASNMERDLLGIV